MKTSNIFEINDDQIRVVVVNEELFGFIYPYNLKQLSVLAENNSSRTTLVSVLSHRHHISKQDKVRLATELDFDSYNISSDGYRDNPIFVYNKEDDRHFFLQY